MIKQGHLPNSFNMDNDRLMEPVEEYLAYDQKRKVNYTQEEMSPR